MRSVGPLLKSLSLAAACVAASSGGARAQVVPVSSAIQLTPQARMENTIERDDALVVQGATLAPLSASVTVTADDPLGQTTTFVAASATWSGPDAGTVSFGPTGSSAEGSGFISYRFFDPSLPGPGVTSYWEYTFVPLQSATFDFTWDVDLVSSTFDESAIQAQGYHLAIDRDPQAVELMMPPNSTGSFSLPLTAGEPISIQFTPNASLTSGGGFDRQVEVITTATIDWRINIPEPAAALLAAPGLLAGLTTRRR